MEQTIDQRQLLETQLIMLKEQKRRLAKVSYIDYLEYTHRGLYRRSKVHTLLAETLEKVESGKIKRLIICMPPRHGKSMTVSESFPSWYLGKNPTKRVMAVAYGETLAERFGEKNKLKLEEYGQQIFGCSIAKGKANKTNWNLDNNIGGMLSTGIGGSIVGQGADLMIIDDPHKNYSEAMNANIRQKIWDKWKGDLNTRLHKDGAVIVIMTRWHEDDLVGRVLDPKFGEVEDWHILSLPAICEEEGDALNRKVGDVLWKEHFNAKWYENKKKIVGTRNWTSQYQQRPVSEEGERIKKKWIKFYDQMPCALTEFDLLIQSWDLAFKGDKSSDYSVGGLIGMKGPNIYLIDMVRKQMDFPQQIQAMNNFKAMYPMARMILIEDKANGSATISMLKQKVSGVVPQKATKSKEERVDLASIYFEAGNIYIPSAMLRSFSGEVESELIGFPNAKYDDIVDMFVQAILKMMDMYIPHREKKQLEGTYTKTELIDLGLKKPEEGYKTKYSKPFKRIKMIRR